MTKTSQYYVTESEISKLLAQSGLPADFQRFFSRDYASLKADASSTSELVVDNDDRLAALEDDLGEVNDELSLQDVRITSVSNDLDAHEADLSAHGANGNIVGTNDYATTLVGGTVKLAAATANATSSTVSVTLAPNAAGVAYSQTDAATWVALLNQQKTMINQLTSDLNALITLFNSSLATERTALQRAP